MKSKIAKAKKVIFYQCRGRCKICFNEGGCQLEKFIKSYGIDHIKNLVYNA